MIWTPTQQTGAYMGGEVELACLLESFPRATTYWTRTSGQANIVQGAKYHVSVTDLPGSMYKSEMRLRIKDLRPSDFGTYTCVARNPLNEAQGSIRVYETQRPSTRAPPFSPSHDANARKKTGGGMRSSSPYDDNQSGE